MGGEGHIAGMISRIRENKKLLQSVKGRRMQDPPTARIKCSEPLIFQEGCEEKKAEIKKSISRKNRHDRVLYLVLLIFGLVIIYYGLKLL
jgi:hypothetical protein